jgi:hypothetical protein
MPPKYKISRGQTATTLASQIVTDKFTLADAISRDPTGFEGGMPSAEEVERIQNQSLEAEVNNVAKMNQTAGTDPQPNLTPTLTSNAKSGSEFNLEREKLATANRIADLLDRISRNKNANPNTGKLISAGAEVYDTIQKADTISMARPSFTPAEGNRSLSNEPSADTNRRKPATKFGEFSRNKVLTREPRTEYYGETNNWLGRVFDGVGGALSRATRW